MGEKLRTSGKNCGEVFKGVKKFNREVKVEHLNKNEILKKRQEIEDAISKLLKETESKLMLEDIKSAIYNENDINDLNKIIFSFDKGQNIDELNKIIQIINDAWNYFPHKCLDGLCPYQKFLEVQKEQGKELLPPSANYGDDLSGSKIGKEYDSLNEQELIELLNSGITNEEELALLVKAMEKKGLKGLITQIDPETDEGKTHLEYVELHKEISEKLAMTPQRLKKWKKILFDKKAGIKEKKKALLVFAHWGNLESWKVLTKYAKKPDSGLKIWVKIALDECQMFLESDLLDKSQIKIKKQI